MSFIYVYYNYKIGYMYVLGFFYQVLLYLLITPSIYINFINIFLTSLVTLAFFYKYNPFQKFYFPFGLFMSLFNVSLGLLETKLHLLKYPIISESGLEFTKLSSHFLTLEYLDFGYFHSELFSPLENISFVGIIALGILIIREYAFILDLFNFFLCFILVASLYNFEFSFYKEKIISLSMTWVLFVYGPGRNFGFSYSFTTIVLGLTGILSYSFWTLSSNLPGMVYLTFYFGIQSLFFVLNNKLRVTKNIIKK